MTPDAVRALIANAILPAPTDGQLGGVTLLPHQRDAVARITRIIADARGVLLADEVGMGKTYVALAVARQYTSVRVIAPAALIPMWRSACARTGLAHARCYSLHAWSTDRPPLLSAEGATLVVIDEAHHLRNANTRRYRQLADALRDCDILLLSATPIHNRPQDLHALISLFRGNRADNLSPQVLANVIVRRRHPGQRHATPNAIPTVEKHPPMRVPQDRETLSRILALPAPLPAHDGAVAGALIRLGLLRAWCSSDAQLAIALTRRRLRGEALHDALREGRHPTQEELRTWVIGDDAGQLGFPELLASHTTESGPMLEVLQRHLDAIGELAQHHQRTASGDAQRVAHLRELLHRHPNTPIVAFSQYTHTIQSVFRALADIAGVGAITGNRARIASGPLPREELLALFAPCAAGRPPPPAHLRVRLLLSTDLLAEGVNLQDAGVVVHLDLPWTHALQTQRVGRVARLGAAHPCVHVYRIAAQRRVERTLRIEQRLVAKRLCGAGLVGSDATRGRRRSAADWRSAVLQRAEVWRARSSQREGGTPVAMVPTRGVSAALALALVVWREEPRAIPELLVVMRRSGAQRGWSISRHPRSVWRAMRQLEAKGAHQHSGYALHDDIARIVRRWMHRRRVRRLVGPTPSQLPDISQVLLQRLDQCHRALSAIARTQVAPQVAAARRCISLAQGAAADSAAHRWLRAFPREGGSERAGQIAAWISWWRSEPALAGVMASEREANITAAGEHGESELMALLIGCPDQAGHYPSA